MNVTLVDNKTAKQFEFIIEGQLAKIEYIWVKDKIYLTHTEVPKSLAGKGVGTAIVKSALEFVDKENLTLVPLCPFVALYIKRHPEWRRLVLKGIKIT